MNLFYTNPNDANQPQTDVIKSLGGFISSTKVRSGEKNAFFTDLTRYGKDKISTETLALILKNDSGINRTNIKVWFDPFINSVFDYELAAVSLFDAECGEKMMERIGNRFSLPANASFYSINGVGNAANLGDLLNGEMLGLWIKRKLNPINLQNHDDCTQLKDKFLAKEELFSLREELFLKFDFS